MMKVNYISTHSNVSVAPFSFSITSQAIFSFSLNYYFNLQNWIIYFFWSFISILIQRWPKHFLLETVVWVLFCNMQCATPECHSQNRERRRSATPFCQKERCGSGTRIFEESENMSGPLFPLFFLTFSYFFYKHMLSSKFIYS